MSMHFAMYTNLLQMLLIEHVRATLFGHVSESTELLKHGQWSE